MKLPELNFSFKGHIQKKEFKGNMVNKYVPFQNLIKKTAIIKQKKGPAIFSVRKEDIKDNNSADLIQEFNTDKLKWDLNHPVDIIVQDSPDGSVNLILNDDVNKPMMINSRFSTSENNEYIITDHLKNKDTNLYKEEFLEQEVSLTKIISKIPQIEFKGIENNGSFPCGSYHFYFKLSDNDDNETDFIGESGVVTCHIGNVNDPFSIRMGMQDENSKKSILFKLTELDGAFDFLKVYYSRTTSGEDGHDLTTYHQILEKFPIEYGIIELQLFGNEPQMLIDESVINEKFQFCEHVKAQAVCKNRLFMGNIQKPIIDYDALKQFALRIIPYEADGENIGQLDENYKETKSVNFQSLDKTLKRTPVINSEGKLEILDNKVHTFEYYNALNIYYNLGYWPEEFYRFGIVYIFNDNSLSHVFNVRGIDWQAKKDVQFFDKDINSDFDGFILNGNKPLLNENALGITRLSDDYSVLRTNKPKGICFKIQEGDYTNNKITKELFEYIEKNIKGYFFVRQKRIPITLAQGYTIGKTKKDFGNLPCLFDSSRNTYFTESFLNQKYDKSTDTWFNLLDRSIVDIDKKNVEQKAIIVPDAIIKEPTFNQVFLGQNFKINDIFNYNLYQADKYRFYARADVANTDKSVKTCKCLNIPSGIELTTNGVDYYSSKAGIPEDIATFTSVLHDWKHEGNSKVQIGKNPPNNFVKNDLSECVPLMLKQDQVIRGVFGAYVGVSEGLQQGTIVNIKQDDFVEYNEKSEEYVDWFKRQISIRKYNYNPYQSISERHYISDLIKDLEPSEDPTICFRGDCYNCQFTHRIIRNHIDKEFPTNDKIVDAGSWDDNFLVITKTKFENPNSTGTEDEFIYNNEIIPLFKAKNIYDKDGNSISAAKAAAFLGGIVNFANPANHLQEALKDWVNEEEGFWEQDFSDLRWGEGTYGLNTIKLVLPSDSKYERVGKSGENWGIPNTWYEYGTDKINRSDVNSVGLGHWVTIRVLSNYNLYMRDIDQYHTDEKVIFNRARGFYPYYENSISNEYKLPESNLINGAANVDLSQRQNFLISEMPYIKQQYDTRLMYSDVFNGGFKNGFRIFRNQFYRDLPKTYGALVKLFESGGDLIGIMEHGILRIPIDERALSGAGQGGPVFVNSENVISEPFVLSDTFGSTFADSVIQTDMGIYGVDAHAKKIWFLKDGSAPILLSDFKLQKFLNDNINLTEWDKFCEIGFKNIKTHYNMFKRDVMFTFYNDDKQWNLCLNEYLDQKFITFYSWIPSFSENINNTFISFDLNDIRNILDNVNGFQNTEFYKHFHNRMGVEFLNFKNIDGIVMFNRSFFDNKDKNNPIVNSCILQHIKETSIYKTPEPLLYDEISNEDNKFVEYIDYPAIRNIHSDIIDAFSLKYNIPLSEFYYIKATVQFDNINAYNSLLSDYTISLDAYTYKRERKQFTFSLTTGTSIADGEYLYIDDYKQLRIKQDKLEELKNRKFLNIKFKGFYYQDWIKDSNGNLIPDIKTLKQKDLYLRLYNPFKCTNEFWKHGQAGIFDGQGKILPTNWYGEQHPFEFEFVVSENVAIQKMYYTLLMISNKTQPEEFEFEIVGESYDWYKYKNIINWINNMSANEDELKSMYIEVLSSTQKELSEKYPDYPILEDKQLNYIIKTIPYIRHIRKDVHGIEHLNFEKNTTDVYLVEDELLSEKRIRQSQLCNNIKDLGRIAGNSEYVEDSWYIEIRPMNFKNAYLYNGELRFKKLNQSRVRDKYVKIKVKYSGKELAVIQGIKTLFDNSYA